MCRQLSKKLHFTASGTAHVHAHLRRRVLRNRMMLQPLPDSSLVLLVQNADPLRASSLA